MSEILRRTFVCDSCGEESAGSKHQSPPDGWITFLFGLWRHPEGQQKNALPHHACSIQCMQLKLSAEISKLYPEEKEQGNEKGLEAVEA